MDPLTQGLLGASAPQASSSRSQAASAGLLGFLAGMAPDLDVLIRSGSDPLLFLEYHRQFTHSLIFIPFGGLICALVLHYLIGRRRSLAFRQTFLFCTLGYATHALLDACTTYGTMLLWPFSDARFAWNVISIIDPLFTVPLLILVAAAALWKRPAFAQLGLAWALVYLGVGLMQRNQAVDMGMEIAASRGHAPIRLEAKPSFGNILVWKIVYETDGEYFLDAVRTGPRPKAFPGNWVQKLDLERDLPWLDHNSQQARDIERFRRFSNGYIARDPDNGNRVIDVRYSLVPNQVNALWSIELVPGRAIHEHALYRTHREAGGDAIDRLWSMVTD